MDIPTDGSFVDGGYDEIEEADIEMPKQPSASTALLKRAIEHLQDAELLLKGVSDLQAKHKLQHENAKLSAMRARQAIEFAEISE